MKLVLLALIGLAVLFFGTYGRSAATEGCGTYSITHFNAGDISNTILLNSQTGQTWMLVFQKTDGGTKQVFMEVERAKPIK